MSEPTIVDVRYGDATTQVETADYHGDKAILRIVGGNNWTWLDMPARLALAQAIAGEGYVVVKREVADAAKEYAESRQAWEDALEPATEMLIGAATWTEICRRQDQARANLLAMFPSVPVAQGERSPLPEERGR